MAMFTQETSPKTDNNDQSEFLIGPLSVLQQAVTNQSQILISCRNNKKLLATLKCFDRHMNMVLENVREMWSEEPKKAKGTNKKAPTMYKDRYMQKMFLRGDSVMLVLRNPSKK